MIFEKAGYPITFNLKETLLEYADVVVTQKDLKGGNPEKPDTGFQGMIAEVLCTRNA